MTRWLRILLLMLAVSSAIWAGDRDDFGVWTEVGVQKVLPRNFFVGIEGELRTRDTSRKVGRVGLGGNVSYKLNKYLRLGAAYNFVESYSAAKTETKMYDDTYDYESRRYTPGYWRPKHKLSLDATASVKLWKLLKVSVRERYQYTHKRELTVSRYEDLWDMGKEDWAGEWEDDPKTKKEENTHILRSRLKLEIDKKRLAWIPFASVETQNHFIKHMHLRNVRTAAGAEYEFNARNSISAAYVFTYDCEDKDRMHAISIGYNFKF